VKILIADDDRISRRLLEKTLEREGYEVVVEHTGEGAFFRVSSEKFDVMLLDLMLPGASYRNPQAIQNFYDRLLEGLRALPGAQDAGAVYCPPPKGDCGDWWYSMVGAPVPAKDDVPMSLFNVAGPGYFETMRIPLREGRTFNSADRASAPLVAIVNETVARQWFPRQSAVGHVIKFGGPYMPGATFEIVGVVGNVNQEGMGTVPYPEIYRPFSQDPRAAMGVLGVGASRSSPTTLMAGMMPSSGTFSSAGKRFSAIRTTNAGAHGA